MQPTFSVIIPTRDRFRQLVACLEAIAAQDFPREKFEVIVVDDGSVSPAADVIGSFQERLSLTVVRQARSAGPSIARNYGARISRGEFLAFTDDDCSPAPDWLSRLAGRFDAMPNQLIGGRVINALTENPYSTTAHVILDVVYEYYDPRRGRPHFFPTSNFALSSKSFRAIGGFDERWPLAAAEDREFCYRWINQGSKMTYAPEAIVYHRHSLTLRSFWSLHFKYGRGAYHYHVLRAGGPGRGGLMPDLGFYWNCLRYPFAHFKTGLAIDVAAMLILWQGANAAGYFWQRFAGKKKLPAKE